MTNREQDLRTALEWYGEQARLARLIHSGGDPGRQALAEDGGKRAAAILAAPPRPVDAERVGDAGHWLQVAQAAIAKAALAENVSGRRSELQHIESQIYTRLRSAGLDADPAILAPAHSPDKAVARDGVAEAFEDAALARDEAGYSGTPASCIRFLSAEVDRLEKALATKPAGTEAGRGVGAEDGWRSKAADEVEGLASLWEGDGHSYAMTIAAILRAEEPTELPPADDETKRTVARAWDRFQSGVAATPTPPVSPTPDSTKPDLPGRILWFLQQFRQSEFGDCADAGAVYAPGCRAEPGSWFDTESKALLAALTPSAPIADPSPDSTGQGDAQTEARERALMEVVRAASEMPRKTPAAGGSCTVHPFQIEAGAVWALDRALRNLAAIPTSATVSQGDAQTQEGGPRSFVGYGDPGHIVSYPAPADRSEGGRNV